ncbi:hypothetical protein ACFE04_009606 [Oxalis oulophora]
MGDMEQNKLMKELSEGKELAKQLQLHYHGSNSSSSTQTCEMLVQRIISTYENALSMLNFSSHMCEESPLATLSESPKSEDIDRGTKGSLERKILRSWTQRVRVSSGTALEGLLDDGFSWRKYGQKDILAAKYPRGYYRCTHRNVQGCLATKQVQRSDEDPMIFEITYRGRHTCTKNLSLPQIPIDQIQNHPESTENPQQDLFNLRSGLEVITENIDSNTTSHLYSSNSNNTSLPYFPSTTSNIKPETDVDVDVHSFDKSMENFCSPSIYPSTSHGTLSIPPTYRLGNNINVFQTTHQDCDQVAQTNSTTPITSTTTSPSIGLDFPFGTLEYDPTFSFDNIQGFFS